MRFANPTKKTRVIASTKGHAIEFPGRVLMDAKGKPPADFKLLPHAVLSTDGLTFVHVPPSMHQECVSAGLESEEAMEPADDPTVPKKPESAPDLEKAMFEAFEVLVEVNARESFAGSGYPKPEAVEKLLGYAVTNAEVKDAWPKYLQSKKD